MLKHKVILIEGPDNVGKSTLIRNLKNKLNDEVFLTLSFANVKQNSPEEHIEYSKELYDNMFKFCRFQTEIIGNSLIIDRSHIGEMVYSPLYRNYSGDYVLDIESEYNTDNFYLIVLTDTAENLISRDDGLSHSIDLDKKNEELNLFREAFKKSNIQNKYMMNIEGHNEVEVLNKVLDYIIYKE